MAAIRNGTSPYAPNLDLPNGDLGSADSGEPELRLPPFTRLSISILSLFGLQASALEPR